ncbi:hypothetical protein PRK78_000222 [Emydomyces testavorans]|uniref:DNA endonuclease activator Ctp1 C-terminal domain-containing protein n=1 Tax=Emydomyces testavorans TaxID=2070801 RepID=A0AAF0DAA7_9EURO|nr:hypothetical protein PRK78_000222 [Emydomyces testavorans]
MTEPSTPVKIRQPTGSPLVPISPDRINQQKMTISPAKSLDTIQSPIKSGRGTSEVQAKVAFLNRLSSVTTPERPASYVSTTTAALQRAILGREEAESALQSTLAQLSEANARERRVSERLESLVEELHALKERQVHERAVFEKEVRKARKEAFRAGSALVKAQEELKYSRGEIKSLKDDVKLERDAKEKAKQEAFERAYALAGLTEELEVLKEKLRSSEAQNQSEILEAPAEDREESPSKSLVAPETAVMSTSPGSRGLKRGQPDSIDHRSPSRKRSLNNRGRLGSPKLGSPVKLSLDSKTGFTDEALELEANVNDTAIIEQLNDDLRWEKRMRRKAEDMLHFLKMECQFKRCSCRVAEHKGTRYIHDASWDKLCQETEQKAEQQEAMTDAMEGPFPPENLPSSLTPKTPPRIERGETEEQPDEPLVTFCPDTGTFRVIPSPIKDIGLNDGQIKNDASEHSLRQNSPLPALIPENANDMQETEHLQVPGDPLQFSETQLSFEVEQHRPLSQPPYSATAPTNHAFHPDISSITRQPSSSHTETQTITTTTIVPLHIETQPTPHESAFCPIPATPINREEALAQIRARRGRTQCALKRSASANDASTRSGVARTAITPIRGSRRIPRMENTEMRAEEQATGLGAGIRLRRDISAPIESVRRTYR